MFLAVLLAAILAALPVATVGAQPSAPRPDTIRVDGSNGVMPLASALARAFEREHPGIAVAMGRGLGSGERLAALRERRIDVALASHGLDTAALRREGFVPHRVATTAVVLAANAGTAARAITSAQVCAILTAPSPSWRGIADSDDAPPMVVVAREESEVDMEVLRREVGCLGTRPMAPHVRIAADTEAMRRALLEQPGAIGITTATVVQQEALHLRALSLDGVAPTADAVSRGRYRLVRDSYFVASAAPGSAVARFLRWLEGESAGRVLAANGAVSVARPPGRR